MEYDLCINCGASKISSGQREDREKIHDFLNASRTIEEMLKKFPNGFSVSPDGSINRIVMATPHIRALEMAFPAAPRRSVYLLVEMIDAV